MKHKARQFELAMNNEPFALIQQSATDWTRVAEETAQLERDRRLSEAQQTLIQTPEVPRE